MSIEEKPSSVQENKIKVIDCIDNINESIHILSNCVSSAKAIKMAALCNSYSKEQFDYKDVFSSSELLQKQLDNLTGVFFNIIEELGFIQNDLIKAQEEKEKELLGDKKRLARLAYCFINNGELERAKKELEKVLA